MPVTIGELTTEVIAEGDAPSPGGSAPAEAQQHLSMIRAQMAAVARDTTRTRAEGFDD